MRALLLTTALSAAALSGAVAQDAPAGAFIEQRGERTMTAEGLGSILVVTEDGETVGDVESTILTYDGEVAGLVIGVGGVLGLAEKPVGVRYEHFDVRETEDGFQFVIDLDRAALDAAPRYEKREEDG